MRGSYKINEMIKACNRNKGMVPVILEKKQNIKKEEQKKEREKKKK